MVPAILKRTVLLWVFVLAACTIHLAPSYDPALVDGLNKAHTETLTLFAGLETASGPETFPAYQERYASVIGQFEALRQRAEAREIPPLAGRLVKLKAVEKLCGSGADATECVNVTPKRLENIVAGLRVLRDRHRTRGLASDSVELARDAYDPAIHLALSVENALKR
ncbi:hypothetical protein FHS95_001247 [Sphingomonas naasensis]|uniref:Uncharacterized protein n=1 Tax=Sphingomonas naasensis TaxID=1344951 RepID=A0A4S1W962_9SPHN|nr:hypothetical protein [Sphingomonas naasensis]NIJ19578.1 hypothetical protein [Sphingomonas naasensis]TGX39309.1 hypothetical protein E5A74_17500 [Sphingomonas naasensis]